MTSAAPVRATDRVSDVLARDPSLVEVFARHAPTFERLRNPLLRRVMARLVTVEQAARVGETPVAALLAELNRALGMKEESTRVTPAAPAPPAAEVDTRTPLEAVTAGAPVIELDVREDLRAGREPFSRIMAAVAALPAGAVLRLRAPFEPVPLFTVMARRGFAHAAEREANGDWSAWFSRSATPPLHAPPPAPHAAGATERAEREVVLDVRGMEPPEPMVRTLAALEELDPDATLVQLNARVPQFLLPILAERGWTYELDTSDPAAVRVRIRRAAHRAGA